MDSKVPPQDRNLITPGTYAVLPGDQTSSQLNALSKKRKRRPGTRDTSKSTANTEWPNNDSGTKGARSITNQKECRSTGTKGERGEIAYGVVPSAKKATKGARTAGKGKAPGDHCEVAKTRRVNYKYEGQGEGKGEERSFHLVTTGTCNKAKKSQRGKCQKGETKIVFYVLVRVRRRIEFQIGSSGVGEKPVDFR